MECENCELQKKVKELLYKQIDTLKDLVNKERRLVNSQKEFIRTLDTALTKARKEGRSWWPWA